MSAALRLAADAARVWLMPWRAARTIREQRENARLLARTLAGVLADQARLQRPRHLYLVK